MSGSPPADRRRRWRRRAEVALAFGLAVIGRARSAVRRRARQAVARRRHERTRARETLPSLYDIHPGAATATRRPAGFQTVPIEHVVGTTRHPSQNTADFLPLPDLRGQNWIARWQRITRANDRLVPLPPVELVKVGDDYFISDGHNRVAAAIANGAVAVDADVTELVVPGVASGPLRAGVASTLVGARDLREAGAGRHSRTAAHSDAADLVLRRDREAIPRPEPGESGDQDRPASPSP